MNKAIAAVIGFAAALALAYGLKAEGAPGWAIDGVCTIFAFVVYVALRSR